MRAIFLGVNSCVRRVLYQMLQAGGALALSLKVVFEPTVFPSLWPPSSGGSLPTPPCDVSVEKMFQKVPPARNKTLNEVQAAGLSSQSSARSNMILKLLAAIRIGSRPSCRHGHWASRRVPSDATLYVERSKEGTATTSSALVEGRRHQQKSIFSHPAGN